MVIHGAEVPSQIVQFASCCVFLLSHTIRSSQTVLLTSLTNLLFIAASNMLNVYKQSFCVPFFKVPLL